MINSYYLIILLIMTLSGAMGGVFFKKYANKNKKYLFLGLFFYATGALLNIALLKVLPYTLVFLGNSLTYVWALLLANIIFKEKIGMYKVIGIIFISAGLLTLVI